MNGAVSPRVLGNKENQLNSYGLVNKSLESWSLANRRKTQDNLNYPETLNNRTVSNQNYKENLIGQIKLVNPTISDISHENFSLSNYKAQSSSKDNYRLRQSTNTQPQQSVYSQSSGISSNQKDIRKKHVYKHYYD